MMRQYLEIKGANPDIVIFFRLGDFYEMFFEDAINVSRELELTLTGKNAGLEERIPMCGIPHHASNIYIEKLVEKGYKVGICEQLTDPKETKGIVERGLIQIISKGTIINNDSLNELENNYIGSLIKNDNYILTLSDLSTGEINLYEITDNVINEILNKNVKELIVTSNIDKNIIEQLKKQYSILITTFDLIEENEEYNYLCEKLESKFKLGVNHLLTYFTKTQMRSLSHMQMPKIIENKKVLKMDIHTKRNLELTETLRLKERTYSLLWLLDKTKTAMGSRMLKSFIENPLIDKKEIEKRYDVVDTLNQEFLLKSELQEFLGEVYDLERLAGRISFGNANARDLIQLRSSLKVLPFIKQILEEIKFYKTIKSMDDLYNLLVDSIYDNPPIGLKEGYLIKNGFNSELDELKDIRGNGKDFIARFEAEEREKTGIKNLKVGYNKVFGYYIEVSKGNTNLVKDEYGYERKQTLANCERYISPILKEKEALILNAEEKIIELEYNLFINIRNKVKEYIKDLQDIAKTISEIDVLQSFSEVSERNGYVRPIFKDYLDITDSRHPVVENVIESEFVKNDIKMDEKTNILLITGPNMAGKSTYMRQVAITSIMAQIGCFVPASKAIMPIFDAIYTRIGASDDLVSGESTFMVEMLEANRAIKTATKNSLVLFDELGRGTATFDGMALAQSIIEYISKNIGCKTFFSTHYHELTDLDQTLKDLKNIHVSAHEENGNITFLHKIKEGSVDKSYGIYVAKLAGLPESLIARANEILKVYENKEEKREILIQESLPLYEPSIIEEELRSINLLNVTPMEAMNILFNLQNKLK
ncbi:MAG: DNA mismatch repair protein MutS [Bacilli bacterium]|nr:DNA mismatch repair protein MutS [Bacilli bacterium]